MLFVISSVQGARCRGRWHTVLLVFFGWKAVTESLPRESQLVIFPTIPLIGSFKFLLLQTYCSWAWFMDLFIFFFLAALNTTCVAYLSFAYLYSYLSFFKLITYSIQGAFFFGVIRNFNNHQENIYIPIAQTNSSSYLNHLLEVPKLYVFLLSR